ncbi:MAG: glycerol-3-phosphate acyltransferase [Clostridia bacterium]|nr:glycerol-3-phosphate acyltransferase [Clostridia bacterium]
MSNWVLLSILAVVSYLYGSINWAIIISKIKRVDIRSMGSGNPGTLNMSRNLGLKAGLLTFLLDVLKGVVPTLLAYFLTRDRLFDNTAFIVADFAVFLCGFCVVMGHIYPLFMKFKGGKGIATTIGVFLVASFAFGWEWGMIALMALVGAGVFIYFTEFGAMGSFIAITPPAIGANIRLFLTYNYAETVGYTYYFIANVLIFAICLFTWFAHRRNIERMLAGDEHPTSIKEMVIKMRLKKQQSNNQKDENK